MHLKIKESYALENQNIAPIMIDFFQKPASFFEICNSTLSLASLLLLFFYSIMLFLFPQKHNAVFMAYIVRIQLGFGCIFPVYPKNIYVIVKK
jgi:hypothetical protein